MNRKYAAVLDDDLPLEEPEPEWFRPAARSAMRDLEEFDDLGLRRLAEFPEDALRPRGRGRHRARVARRGTRRPYRLNRADAE